MSGLPVPRLYAWRPLGFGDGRIWFRAIPGFEEKVAALAPVNWQATFSAWTGRAPTAARWVESEVVELPDHALVGDLCLAGRVRHARSEREREAAIDAFRTSVVAYHEFLKGPQRFWMPQVLFDPPAVGASGLAAEIEANLASVRFVTRAARATPPGEVSWF